MSKSPVALLRAGLATLAAFTMLQLAPAQAQTQTQDKAAAVVSDDRVVAVVKGSKILFRDVRIAHQNLPQQYRGLALEKVYKPLVQQLVERRLVLLAAEAEKLGDDPAIMKRVAQARDRILEQTYLTNRINAVATEANMRARYEAEKTQAKGPDEVRASHIPVETQAEADVLVTELNKGGDFAAIAKKKSKGPSGAKGGDLGYFTKDKMVPEFANAAFALKVDEISAPVKTGFGWHVIKLVDRRQGEGPSFASRAPAMRQVIAQEVAEALLGDLAKDAKIEYFGLDGKPAKDFGAGKGSQ